jgi:hypothetical protein
VSNSSGITSGKYRIRFATASSRPAVRYILSAWPPLTVGAHRQQVPFQFEQIHADIRRHRFVRDHDGDAVQIGPKFDGLLDAVAGES